MQRPGKRSTGDGTPSLTGAVASLTRGAEKKAAHSSSAGAAAGGPFAACHIRCARFCTVAVGTPAFESARGDAPLALYASCRGFAAAAGATGVGAGPAAVGSSGDTLRAARVVVTDACESAHADFTPPDAGNAGRASPAIVGFRSYAPAQVAAAVAAVACVHLCTERQVDLTRAIPLAADEGTIDGNIVLDAPEEEVVAALLALSRRTCRGAIPLGTRVCVLRFIRAQR